MHIVLVFESPLVLGHWALMERILPSVDNVEQDAETEDINSRRVKIC